jgi:hypothetical protein
MTKVEKKVGTFVTKAMTKVSLVQGSEPPEKGSLSLSFSPEMDFRQRQCRMTKVRSF